MKWNAFISLSLLSVVCSAYTIDGTVFGSNVKTSNQTSELCKIEFKNGYDDSSGRFLFAVRDAQNKSIEFFLPKTKTTKELKHPAYSVNNGVDWHFIDSKDLRPDSNSFVFKFGQWNNNVHFADSLQYYPMHWNKLLKQLSESKVAYKEEYHEMPILRLGNMVSARHKILIVARHDISDASSCYVVQGIAEQLFNDDGYSQWLKNDIELMLVPFADYKGATSTNYIARNLKYDYHLTKPSRYPETASLRKLVEKERPDVVLTISNSSNDYLTQLSQMKNLDDGSKRKQERFAKLFKLNRERFFEFDRTNIFTCSKNSQGNGLTLSQWASATYKNIKLATDLEVPTYKTKNHILRWYDFKSLSSDIVHTLYEYLREDDNWCLGALPQGFSQIFPADCDNRRSHVTLFYHLGGLRNKTRDKAQHYMSFSFADLTSVSGKYFCVAYKAQGNGSVASTAFCKHRLNKVISAPSSLFRDEDMSYVYIFGPIEHNDHIRLEMIADGFAKFSDIRFFISDRSVNISKTYPQKGDTHPLTLPKGYIQAKSYPYINGETNLSKFADVSSIVDFRSRLFHASDGAFGTYESGGIVLEFPKAVEITGFRWLMPERFMEVYADKDGTGRFSTCLFRDWNGLTFSMWNDLREYVWREERFKEPVRVKRLLVRGGRICEFEVLGKSSQVTNEKEVSFVRGGSVFSFGESLANQPKLPEKNERLWFGFCLEPWMFGMQDRMINHFKKGVALGEISDWGPWQNMAKDFHELNANFILLFPPSVFAMPNGVKPRPGSAYPYPLMWPSRVWYVNQTNDLLNSFNKACHKEGFLNFVIPRAWDFNTNKCDEVKQVVLAKEIAQCASDGVPICYDEQSFYMPMDFKDEKLREEFFKWSGQTNLPTGAFYSDDKATRLGYLFSANKKAEWMAKIKEETDAINPDALTFGGFAGCDHYQMRNQTISGSDFWGWEGKCDVIGGDGTYFGVGASDEGGGLGTLVPAVQTAVQVSCTPKRKSMATVNFNWGIRWDEKEKRHINPLVYADYPDMAYKASAMACYFNKGEFLNFWRYNFMDMKGPNTRKAIKEAGRMASVLSSWGGKNAEIPKDVLVLRSRTSEDWWAFRYRYKSNEECHISSHRYTSWGHKLFFWTSARLAEAGIPFEVYQLQRVDAWKDIAKKYKVIILPFAYSISDDEHKALSEAIKAGVKVVVLGGDEAGSVDGIGEKRQVNAFENLVIERFEIANPYVQSTLGLANNFYNLLNKILPKPSLRLNKSICDDVQAYMLSVSNKEKILTLANWSERDTTVNLSVALPKGTYRLEVCSGDKVHKGLVNGREIFTSEEATALQFNLKKEDVLLLRIKPKGWF